MAVEVREGHEWLKSLARFGIRPGLERTQRVLQTLGNPHQGLRFYHVAGTNGKGSVCTYLAEILSYRQLTAVFTSPAFDGYQGRMVVGGQVIPSADFERLAILVRATVSVVTAADPLTEFEVLTCIACLYFKEQGATAVVWETGLGGRYDSTNVVDPTITAITNVGLDHTQVLGLTVTEIARDKAGIVKRGRPVVTAAQGAALSIIIETAEQQNASCYINRRGFLAVRRWISGQCYVDYRGVTHDWYGLPLNLWGSHQAENAGIALAMYELSVLSGFAAPLSVVELRQAMSHVRWPGRFEVLSYRGIDVILDGAHNPDGARVLAQSLREWRLLHEPQAGGWTFVIGVFADKDYRSILRAVIPLADQIVTVAPDHTRSLSASELMNAVRMLNSDVKVLAADSVAQGLQEAVSAGAPICCMGSLYTVDEARKAIHYRLN